jgi:hypothetical protein
MVTIETMGDMLKAFQNIDVVTKKNRFLEGELS